MEPGSIMRAKLATGSCHEPVIAHIKASFNNQWDLKKKKPINSNLMCPCAVH